jgi:hypothetical protein
MPTRRIFEMVLVMGLLLRPAFGLMHVEMRKLLNEQQPGTFLHGVAEIGTVVLS